MSGPLVVLSRGGYGSGSTYCYTLFGSDVELTDRQQLRDVQLSFSRTCTDAPRGVHGREPLPEELGCVW